MRKESTLKKEKGVGGFLPLIFSLILGVQDVFCNPIIAKKGKKVKRKLWIAGDLDYWRWCL
jgi:hypothetical protein